MSRTALDFWFYLTLFGGLPLGIALSVLWARKILPRLLRRVDRRTDRTGTLSVPRIAMQSLFFMVPGLALLVVCSAPALYFGNLRKQWAYCLKVLEVNTELTRENRLLRERCGCFDVDELFAARAVRGGGEAVGTGNATPSLGR